jgi:nicotinate phosphoribosyltransferase
VVLLIDTYDTEAAASKVVELAGRLAEEGIPIKGVRIDSGDLAEHARKVRKILDDGGHPEITIFASGNLDEYALVELMKKEAPIDGFGIGTHLDTSADRSYLDYVYKLQEYAGIARRKRSEGKATWPGRKQVYRYRDGQGRLAYDLLTLEADPHPGEPLIKPLIKPVMRVGKRVASPEPLSHMRDRVAEGLASLPERLRGLEQTTPPYEVRVSEAIQRLAAQVDRAARLAS